MQTDEREREREREITITQYCMWFNGAMVNTLACSSRTRVSRSPTVSSKEQ